MSILRDEDIKKLNIIPDKVGKTSAEFTLLSAFIHEIDYGYALQGRIEQLKTFRENNDIDDAKYSINHEHIVHALARGGHLNQIYAYTKTHHLNIKNFNAAIIKGLAAVGHHQLLEKYCLQNNIATSTLIEGLIEGLNDLLISCEYLRDEDALRMLIDAKDSQYKKILQEALSSSKIILLNNHFKFWDVLPQPEKNLDNHAELDNIEIDFSPSKKLQLSFPPLQPNTLWIYADAIGKIMAQENMTYSKVVATYFFIDENDNDPKPLPDYVKPCYQWANAFNCLYSNHLNPLLEKEKSFEKRTILLQLTVEGIEKYIETIHLKPCNFTADNTTEKLNALSDFKQKAAIYLGNKTEKNKRVLSESADFLKPNHPYLFKMSSHRYPEQYWVEILAYQIGIYMGVVVPPTFVAYDDQINQSAALIEWFYSPSTDIYIAGGSYFKRLIPNFDEKSGYQHNFETIRQMFSELVFTHILDWQTFWAKALTFDALIGNTDRHQDNWGIIITREREAPNKIKEIRISPVFDNGTSMGHEISPSKLKHFKIENRLQTYVLKGTHHMKWALRDEHRVGHAQMLTKFAHLYPQTRQVMLDCLRKVNDKIFSKILDDLIKFDVPVKLTPERAVFMLELLNFRHQRLLNELDKSL